MSVTALLGFSVLVIGQNTGNKCGEKNSYLGAESVTQDGIICQAWNKNTPHVVQIKPMDYNHSHCRNPDGDTNGPWCYTTSRKSWDYCRIPQCHCEHTCITKTDNGYTYNGSKDVTKSGYACQEWDQDDPHKPRVLPKYTAHRFCRNPDNDPGGPWCYTTNPIVRWEHCDIPTCADKIECKPYTGPTDTIPLPPDMGEPTDIVEVLEFETPEVERPRCGNFNGHVVIGSKYADLSNFDTIGNVVNRKRSVVSNMVQGGTQIFVRIINGKNAPLAFIPHQASIRDVKFKYAFCGGSIISRQWILTAAHCIQVNTHNDMIVTAGHVLGHYLDAKKEATFQARNVSTIIEHPKWNPDSNTYDFALLKTTAVFLFTNAVQPVCLPSTHFNPERNIKVEAFDESDSPACLVSGWGVTHRKGSNRQLQMATVPVIEKNMCNNMFKKLGYGEEVTGADTVCAGYMEGGIDACQGDSGGPLSCLVGNRWSLAGVVSWGIGCAEAESPGVYGDVHHIVGWIKRVEHYCAGISSDENCIKLAKNKTPK